MIKKTIEIYIAEDGREFQNEQECLNYERESALSRKFLTNLREIRDYCDSKNDCTEQCMFYDTCRNRCMLYSMPHEWDLMERGE